MMRTTQIRRLVHNARLLLVAAAALSVGFATGGYGRLRGDGGTAHRGALTRSTPEHGHAAAHGGVVVSVGESHHAEAVWEPATGRLRVYVLGADEGAPFPIPVQNLTATLQSRDQSQQALALRANPLPGEAAGSFASRFEALVPRTENGVTQVGSLPPSLTVVLPLGGSEHRVRFAPLIAAAAQGQKHDSSDNHAAAAPTARESALFLTPGGLYTQADIAANGDVTPAQRFRGMMASHNRFPPKGARLCPISGTQANPKFAWFIGGKRYLFCCPPCVEEFVQQAKKRPATIRPPQAYIKQG